MDHGGIEQTVVGQYFGHRAQFTDSRSAQTQKLSRRMQRLHDISIMRVYASTIESEY